MAMPGRTVSSSSYRYGFNSQERSTEINDNSYTAEFWQYDSRIGRRWNIDPVVKENESPYSVFSGNPIWLLDRNGSDTTKPESLKTKQYDASSWWSPLTKLIPGTGVVEHSHSNDIDNIYSESGGDTRFNANEGTIDKMNSLLKPVTPGTIILPGAPAITNLNSAFYSGSESGSEVAWINLMLGGMIKGTIPENIVFSENGTVSNYLRGSSTLNTAIRTWFSNGQNSEPFGVNYGLGEQFNDAANNLSVLTVGNFVGSAVAQITVNKEEDILRIRITNVTSVHSGDYKKHLWWHDDDAPFIVRDPKETGRQPYSNFSQTYQLKFSYNEMLRKIANEYILIE